MGIIHIPRTIAASLRGAVKRRISPLSEQEISLIGTPDVPHIYSSRAGMFDVDLMGHMNNAAYLQHAELARWEWSAFGGSLAQAFKTRSFFIVTASMIRYRREIVPLKRFDIETRLVGLDDRNLWVYQTFHHHIDRVDKLDRDNSNEAQTDSPITRGKILAQILTQAVIVKTGEGVVNPSGWLEDNSMYSRSVLDGIIDQKSEGMESIFDEKTKRFVNLEDVMKKSASSHDANIPT